MKITRSIAELRATLADRPSHRPSIGFVPTMGALHEGHLSLVRAAREGSHFVVVSIFVNPRQFGPSEDLQAYPRDEARDLELLRSEGVDVVFLPAVEEMYPAGSSTSVTVGPIGDILEGAARPGHFAGVATIVTTLFNIVRPEVAWFGQKDAQQLAVIRRVVSDLSLSVGIRGCPTVRARDGLALSSRNAYLSDDERARATSLFVALQQGAGVLESERNPEAAEKTMVETMTAHGIDVDYAVVVDPDDLAPYEGPGPALLAVAGRAGKTRLIDNLLLSPPDHAPAEE
jgi:pantoate--beta-alanine ligase